MHPQVLTKVWANVDGGVRHLVDALTELGVQTISSCQGPPASVSFYCGDWWNKSWQRLAEMSLGRLGPALADAGLGDLAQVRIDMNGTVGIPYGTLTVEAVVMENVLDIIRTLAIEGAVSRTS